MAGFTVIAVYASMQFQHFFASRKLVKPVNILRYHSLHLAVYPAAGLIDYYRGDKLILVNKTATARDGIANLTLQESIGELFDRIKIS